MKYKVGDVVKLKSAEELSIIHWRQSFADKCGSKEVKILAIDCGDYVINIEGSNLHIGENAIKKIVSEDSEDFIYTFDELKKRVNDLKDYATSFSSELNVGLSIEVETEIECDDWNRKSAKGFSRINIRY